VDGLYTVEYLFTNHYFYKPGTHAPLLAIYDQEITTAGSPSSSQSAVWMPGGPAAINEAMAQAIGIEVYPNPANTTATLVFGTEGGDLQLDVLDARGSVVRCEKLSGMGIGIQTHELDVNALPPGIYQVRLLAANGQQGVQRLVVQ
jgi:type IX secretion system substrate protein